MLQAFLQKCSPSLRSSIKGILFFGTPNLGFQESNRVQYVAAMSTVGHSIDPKFMLQLSGINEDFKHWLRTETFLARNVICFYERLPVTDNIIVS